jgi:hypothetical protein
VEGTWALTTIKVFMSGSSIQHLSSNVVCQLDFTEWWSVHHGTVGVGMTHRTLNYAGCLHGNLDMAFLSNTHTMLATNKCESNMLTYIINLLKKTGIKGP